MMTKILFPKIGFSMEEGKLVEWLVADGAHVLSGQPIYTMESEKSVLEIESPATGRLKTEATAGETYQVGAVLGEIE
jgi:pyruvate/2-oxoglutarate dehydrogenase complex dihydrolipoamide acyltransferase (E2) component